MTNQVLPSYEIIALHCGQARGGKRSDFFLADDRPEDPSPLDFLCFLLKGPEGIVAVDTGFSPELARAYGVTGHRTPADAAAEMGIALADVGAVVLTHAHYDHTGNLDQFPNAQFYLQRAEMAHICGPDMRFPFLRTYYSSGEIAQLIGLLHEGRLILHDKEHEIAPGISLHWVGGHAAGQEIVRVHTDRGWVVLASDALHYYEEYDRRVPFAGNLSSIEMLRSHDLIAGLAASDDHIVPGHDPEVMQIYPAAAPAVKGRAARLDLAPRPRF